MKMKRYVLITAAVIAAAGTAVFFGIKQYARHTRTVMVFGEDVPYSDILDEGLPDERDYGSVVDDTVHRLIGFDPEDPYTVMKSYSAIFGDDDEAASASEEPVVSEEPHKLRLPTVEQISASTGISVNNATQYSVNADELCEDPLNIGIDSDGPQVLIVHTHTTECYVGDNMDGESERNTNETKNMVMVGEEIKNVLDSYGISCIHDKTIHDYPTYQGAYTRALETIERNLKEYPSIKLVFDVHRDAFVYNDGSKLRVECEIDGVSTAKVMIVCGTDAMGLENPKWRENFKLAAKIQNAAQIMYPGMMRPINLRRERFNMHVTTGSLLFEVGSNGNTLDQAVEGGKNLAHAIAAVLLNQ